MSGKWNHSSRMIYISRLHLTISLRKKSQKGNNIFFLSTLTHIYLFVRSFLQNEKKRMKEIAILYNIVYDKNHIFLAKNMNIWMQLLLAVFTHLFWHSLFVNFQKKSTFVRIYLSQQSDMLTLKILHKQTQSHIWSSAEALNWIFYKLFT